MMTSSMHFYVASLTYMLYNLILEHQYAFFLWCFYAIINLRIVNFYKMICKISLFLSWLLHKNIKGKCVFMLQIIHIPWILRINLFKPTNLEYFLFVIYFNNIYKTWSKLITNSLYKLEYLSDNPVLTRGRFRFLEKLVYF